MSDIIVPVGPQNIDSTTTIYNCVSGHVAVAEGDAPDALICEPCANALPIVTARRSPDTWGIGPYFEVTCPHCYVWAEASKTTIEVCDVLVCGYCKRLFRAVLP